MTVGHPNTYGMPTPSFDLLDELPLSNDKVPDLIRQAPIHIRSNVIGFDGKKTIFEDKTQAPIKLDGIIFATGFYERIPFLSTEYVNFEDPNFDPAFFTFHPTLPGLFLFPEVTVAGGAWPVLYAQADAMAAFLAADETGMDEAQIFNQRRQGLPLDFKGHLFKYAKGPHADHQILIPALQDLAKWLRTGIIP